MRSAQAPPRSRAATVSCGSVGRSGHRAQVTDHGRDPWLGVKVMFHVVDLRLTPISTLSHLDIGPCIPRCRFGFAALMQEILFAWSTQLAHLGLRTCYVFRQVFYWHAHALKTTSVVEKAAHEPAPGLVTAVHD